MFRSLLLVLAVVCLLASVSAQTGSSSSFSWYTRMSSSSSSLPVAASTGVVTPVTPGAPDAYPSGSYAVTFEADFAFEIVDPAATAILIQLDIAVNLANGTGINSTVISEYIVITQLNGTVFASNSRRLLQSGNQVNIAFVLLGNITNTVAIVPYNAVNNFKTAAAAGTLSAPNSGATIPAQNITTPQAVGSSPSSSSSSSTGYSSSGASSVASASVVLLFAAVASVALLL